MSEMTTTTATTATRMDGLLQAVVASVSGRQGGMSPADFLPMYIQGGLPARIIDMPADDAVSKGIAVTGDPSGTILAEFDRLALLPAMANALRWSRLTGGGALVLIADDGGTLADPLNPDRLQMIESVCVIDASGITTATRYSDPNEQSFGLPERYMVPFRDHRATALVHETRLLPIPGDPVPPLAIDPSIPWCGRSAAPAAFTAAENYRSGVSLMREILRRKQQAVHKMAGLADMLQADLEHVVRDRITLADSVRGVLNGVAVDAEDDYTVIDTQITGVADAIQELQIALSAETGIPVTRLFGRSPAGMNATGQADASNYTAMVANLQVTRLQPAVERMVALILAQRGLAAPKGQPWPPESWTARWNPLAELTATEAATVEKTKADALAQEMAALDQALGTSAISEQEARQYIVQRGLFGLQAGASDGQSGAAAYAGDV